MISIHTEWAEKILNGEKTLELRPWIPNGYVGWVYVYITKNNYKNHLYNKDGVWTLTNKTIFHYPYKNICGKVAFRFWFENYDTYKFDQDDYWNVNLNKLCLTYEQVYEYGKGRTLYAWHIDKLEIFDKPKELSEFYHYKKKWIYCGMDCPPYVDEVKVQLTKAPQKMVWVYGGEQL
jgi:predicted transcriptional regulator